MKHRRGWRKKGIRYVYDGDGRFTPERLPRYWKRYWSRWKKRLAHKTTED